MEMEVIIEIQIMTIWEYLLFLHKDTIFYGLGFQMIKFKCLPLNGIIITSMRQIILKLRNGTQ